MRSVLVNGYINGIARRNLVQLVRNYVRHIMAVAVAFEVGVAKYLQIQQIFKKGL